MRERKRVGEILVDAGVIDAHQLAAALGEQARWGRRLGVTLIKLGMVEEGHLIRALAKQLDLPVASLAGKRIPDEVIALVPGRVASEHGVIPLFTKQDGPGRQLFLGMEDPSNLEVLDDLSFRTGMEIHPVMIGPSELGEAIDRYYHRGPAHPRVDATLSDPAAGAAGGPEDTMGVGSLRIVTDDAPQPGTRPAIELGAPGPLAGAAEPVADGRPEAGVSSRAAAIELKEPVARLPEGLLEDVARAVDESERTRLVAKAVTQLLIEKGVLTLAEIQARIEQLKAAGTPAEAGRGDGAESDGPGTAADA